MKVKVGQIYDFDGVGIKVIAPCPEHKDMFYVASVKDRGDIWSLTYTMLSELVLIEGVS